MATEKELNQKTMQTLAEIMNQSYKNNDPIPPEVYKKLEQENIELEGEEKKLFETIYRGAKELEKQELSSDELENIAGGNSKFDDFLAKHPKLNKAFFILGILETTLMASWAIYGTYLNMKGENQQ